MRDSPKSTERRTLLRRGLLALAGALGAGAAAHGASAGPAPGAAAKGTALTLHGRQWHVRSQACRPGELPTEGDRLYGFGELLDGPDGARVGEFYATSVCLPAPFGPGLIAAATAEQHTFALQDGTLMGMGLSRPLGQEQAVFAVVGGTGRFAGATGSYVARQQPRELGGDGTAEFVFTLT